MITTSSRNEKAAKQEASPLPGGGSSRQWSSAGFRNPRIVRVSRTFGGKDRHSKVCTVRGLRDRRIRLSVPTAVQLYELQDRLGLSQPSKVIDWLIDNTKLDIDKLPPLQFPPQGPLLAQFHHHHHDLMSSQDHQFSHKLFGLSPYSHNHNNNNSSSTDHALSQIGLGQFSLPPQFDASSSSSSLFNSHLFLSYGQPSSSAASLFAPMYQLTGANTDHPAVTVNNNNNHDARSSSAAASRMIINHNHQIQLLTGGATGTTSPNTTSSLIVPNYSLMSSSSLHNSTSNNANEAVPQNLFKSFPSIFNPRFLSQPSFGNRQEKDHS